MSARRRLPLRYRLHDAAIYATALAAAGFLGLLIAYAGGG